MIRRGEKQVKHGRRRHLKHGAAQLAAAAAVVLTLTACGQRSGDEMNADDSDHSAVTAHAAPAGEGLSEDFSLKVNGVPVPVYRCRVSAVPFNQVWPGYQRPLDQTELASFAYCGASGAVEVEAEYRGKISSAAVRPLSKKLTPQVAGSRISFKVPGPGFFMVEVNGRHGALHLFIDPPEERAPARDEEGVLFFGPGVHRPGKVTLKSDQTVYVAPGAVVYGSFGARDAHNIRILGRGIVDVSESPRGKGGGAIRLHNCSGVRIEGLVLRDPDVWCCSLFGCRDVEIARLKLVGLWRYNADGIDICNSQKVRVRDCFVRAFDDCIVLKGLKWRGGKGRESYHRRPVKDVRVERCVLWNDWGRALEVGAETSAPEIADVVFRDCDIVRATHIAMDIQHGDRASIRDVRFEDIRVEMQERAPAPRMQKRKGEKYDARPGKYLPTLMVIDIRRNNYSKDGENGTVAGVTFRNITVTAPSKPRSRFSGLDPEHGVGRVVIDNLSVNGKRCNTAQEANLKIGPHVADVKFLPETGKPATP
jgi:hypothetical protein